MRRAFFCELLEGVTYAKPCRDRMAALHPSEDPGDGAKIFQAAALAAPGRAGANAGQIQFVYWRRLFEVLEHVRVLSDLAAVKPICLLRRCFYRFFPLGRKGGSSFARTLERFQAGGDHEFKIPFGEHGICVLPVQHLSLFRNSNLAREAPWRLRENRRMRGAATATDGAPSAVEETKFDAE